jgi:NOL1/NOP2/fmu family ribosome biogenesis protein
MGNYKFVRSAEKKKMISELSDRFGITDVPYLLIESGTEKVRAFSGSLSKEEILALAEMARVEGVGFYFLKKEITGIRLSFDATQVLKDQITKNIVDIDEKQFQMWIRGYDLEIKMPRGVYVIRHKGDFLGCGKSNEEKIFNHVPKERRIKKPLPSN